MNNKTPTCKASAEKTVRDIRRAPRRHYSAEEKSRIVLEGVRGAEGTAERCRSAVPLPAAPLLFGCLDPVLWVSFAWHTEHRLSEDFMALGVCTKILRGV
jgi:hypothetical protein